MVTVAEYCKLRGVTRQFVSEYIKKGKIQAVELPLFAEYQGKRLSAGRQIFVEPPGGPTLEMGDVERANWLASMAATDPGIRADIAKLVLRPKLVGATLDSYYEGNAQAAWETAKEQLRLLLLKELDGLEAAVGELADELAQEK